MEQLARHLQIPFADTLAMDVNVLAVKEGSENNEAIQALVKALQSSEVRDYINETYDGAYA